MSYCVEVVDVNRSNQPVHYVGPFLAIEFAERWITENKDGYFNGRQFRVKQLIDVRER